ncbi:DUF4230 domain-containing protein [Collinsella tanakaei]|uniref:DUF4230 domain-containing protein n=1 Tax=Collinsella tanakaei TaxID=626935 RepID=UPI0025A33F45|nr:DUF4230 domain-containing protein [Collinsella tanakaei]MDM8300216.1 DUF4230 domain-containing protein [Collinsella tanakaei]
MVFKLPKSKIRTIKVGAIAASVGLVFGIVGTLFVANYNPPDEEKTFADASIVFDRIVSRSELVSVSQDYNIVDKVRDANTFFDWFDIPFTENSFWYRYTGTIKAGVNLETAGIEQQGAKIIIELDPAYIISNDPDMDESGALEENNNILNPIHVEDVDEFQRLCEEESESEAIENGLLEEAHLEAESRLTNLFYAALGDEYDVEFVWREEPTENEAR